MNLIGISGKIGSGKTTMSLLLRKSKDEYEIKSFAENVRKTVALLTGISIENMRSVEEKNYYVKVFDKTIGELLQEVGTKMREIHPDVWPVSLFSSYNQSVNDHSKWVIDDVRFPNEADKIKAMGGILIRLEGDPGNIRAVSKRDLNHISETSLDNYDKFDIIIDTNKYNPSSCIDILEGYMLSGGNHFRCYPESK